MVQTSFDFNPLPSYPANPYPHGTQKWRIYDFMLKSGGVITNVDIVRGMGIFNSTGRMSEVRQFLAGKGFYLDCKVDHSNVWKYSIIHQGGNRNLDQDFKEAVFRQEAHACY